MYFGFSAHLSLVAKVSHWVLTGLLTIQKSLSSLSILTVSLAASLIETWPSMETVVPWLTRTPTTSIVLSASITTGLKLSEWGQMGVIAIASILGARIGPPAERL
jgi:hypothetical protein